MAEDFEIIFHDTTDIRPANEKTGPWVHPLDRPEMQAFLKDNLPTDIVGRLNTAVRPELSKNPTKEETEEASKIQAIREPIETPNRWAMRTLYEESFATYDPLGQPLLFVTGGVLSHFDIPPSYKEHLAPILKDAPELFSFSSREVLAELLQHLNKAEQPNQAFDTFVDIQTAILTIGKTRNPIGNFAMPPSPSHMMRNPNITATYGGTTRIFEAGWQRVQAEVILQNELRKPVTDQVFLDEFNIPPGTEAYQAFLAAYDYLRKPGNGVINSNEDGTFTEPTDTKFNEGLRKLAILRSSPDFQFIYKHYSFKGDVNEAKEKDLK